MQTELNKATAFLLVAAVIFLNCGSLTASAEKAPPPDSEHSFRCDWFNDSIIYPFEYSDKYFSESAYKYNHRLATFALCASMATFDSFDTSDTDKNIVDFMKKCGFSTVCIGYDTEGYDTVGLAIGSKDITLNGKEYTILLVTVRSGNYGMEWGGNVRMGVEGNHEGFDISKSTALDYLNTYLKDHMPSKETKILISGYSRGASIANLIGAELNSGRYRSSIIGEEDNIQKVNLKGKNIYTYTFEAAQPTVDKNAHSRKYSNIFNIVNPNDYVPLFAMDDFGFTHYGNVMYFPTADNCSNYDSYYKRICSEFDSFMGYTGKKAVHYFYDKDSSRSSSVTMNYIVSGLARDIMLTREHYSEKYEDLMIYLLGQYAGKKRNIGNVAKTAGAVMAAAAVSLTPSNVEKVETQGFRSYLAGYLAESTSCSQLSEKQLQDLIDLIIELLKFAGDNRGEIFSLAAQLKTMIFVHQPFIALTWMRTLSEEEFLKHNQGANSPVSIRYSEINIKYDTHAKLQVDTEEQYADIVWSTSDPSVASVSADGYVYGITRGSAVIFATATDEHGLPIAEDSVRINVQMSSFRYMIEKIKSHLR